MHNIDIDYAHNASPAGGLQRSDFAPVRAERDTDDDSKHVHKNNFAATDVARTLSSNHMLENAEQTIEFAVLAEDFTCLLPSAVVTGARDCPKGGLSLVSAAPRLISALRERIMLRLKGVEMSLDPARKSACATSPLRDNVKLFLRQP